MKKSETLEHRKSVFRAWKADPARFVKDVFGVDPSGQQKALLKAVSVPGARVSVRSGHGTGKSTCLAWLVIWHTFLFPHSRVPCTAPTAPQLESVLWAEIAKWLGKAPWLKDHLELNSDTLRAKGRDQFAKARTARAEQPDALQGFHADNLLFLIDEAAGVPEPIFEAAEGAWSTAGTRVVMTANPTQLTGYFHRSHHRDRGRWTCLQFNGEDSPLVSKEWIKEVEESYGKDSDFYRVRVLGDFPRASSMQFIPADVVESAMGKVYHGSAYVHAPRILGVDVARYGDDKSVIFFRQGVVSKVCHKVQGQDTMRVAALCATTVREEKPDAVFIDEGGVGAGVVDRLRQLGFDVIGVNFGSKAEEDSRYGNKRVEMWARLRQWLKDGGSIPKNQELQDDLVGPQYSMDTKDRIVLERKEDMKKRGLASPDLGDALALTFAEFVPPADFVDRGYQAQMFTEPRELTMYEV